MEYDLVDTIENGIVDYCIRKGIRPGDIPFSIFEMSVHVNDYVNTKLNEVSHVCGKEHFKIGDR